jgi:hypothetical protein
MALTAEIHRALVSLWVKTGKAQCEQMFSALPSTTDIKATYVSLVPIGRLVALDHPSGFFGLKKTGILRTKEAHRSAAKSG